LKQILQSLKTGDTEVSDVPCPSMKSGQLLIRSSQSVVSAGTERMLVDFGKANLIKKARQQPDKVRMVLDKVNSDGLMPTIDAVRSKLDQPLPLGYCNAGVVLDSDVNEFKVGDRVVSNGSHAEVVRVAKNLCAKIPDEVDDETAAFTVLGAIGLQGIRLIKPTLGEAIVVTGLGMVGLMCVQILRANGCRVLGIDFDSHKCELARQYGAETVDLSKGEDFLISSKHFSRGRGVDGVIISAASQSHDIVHQSAEMCRKRGRIVLVGVVGLNLRREDFFQKELSFQVSASYGPGRYDSLYEEHGQDYPIGFVRWTEQRNFEAVLDMMASGKIEVKSLITHRFKIDDAIDAYKVLDDSSALGIVLEYPNKSELILRATSVNLNTNTQEKIKISSTLPIVGFIGAGNYASRTLIPAFKECGAVLDTLVTSGGISGVHNGKKNGFRMTSTEIDDVISNENINTIAIVTRHNDHANQVVAALKAGNNVFVEKPLALNLEDLDLIDTTYKNSLIISPVKLMVGFNRRFAPHIIKMKELLNAHRTPKTIIITVNAGPIPVDHWVHDLNVGGGRIIGEACHFIDLMRFLIGSPVVSHKSMMMGRTSDIEVINDKVTINLSFIDGSFGAIHYLANGGSVFPKERVEVFCNDAVLQMDNYRELKGYGWTGFKKMKLFKQDKGQKACAKAFTESIVNGNESPISYEEVMESSRVSIEVANSLRN
jgi:predicted dehydrogenase/threonine dehydrogenase-like Zn-dependent dehydrogenase